MASATIDESEGTVPPAARDALLFESRTRAAFHLLSAFCVLLVLSWLGVDLSRHSGGVSTIWLSNGLLFAIIIRKPYRLWLPFALAGLTADIAADRLFGDSFQIALGVSCANSIEVFFSAFLLTRWFGSPLRLSRPKPLFAFLGIAVLTAPALTGMLSSSWLNLFDTLPWWQTTRTWYLGDALGMAMVAPLAYALQEPGFFTMFERRRLPNTLLTLSVLTIVALLEFSQSREPGIFLVLPALIYVVFRLGFPGAVMAISLIAGIAISLTVSGHGPMMLSSGTTLLHKIVVVQVFVAVALFTAFPIASLLEERKSLELSLQESEAKYRELANTDALTGQANRRAFDERLQAEWQRTAAFGLPLSLLSIDIDFFKSYNDIYGHIAGDDCLRRIANLAAGTTPPHTSARLYRLGGEEFAIIFPEAEASTAFKLAEQLRQAVSGAHIEHNGSPLGYQSVSVGVATTVPSLDRSAVSLLALSDQALYTAKRNGRDCCATAC